jgi:hypothetical protein
LTGRWWYLPRVLRGPVLLLAMVCLLAGCRSPQPRSPEVVRQKAAQKAAAPPEPSVFDRLTLRPEQRETVNGLLATVRSDLAAYDRYRLQLLEEIVVEVRLGTFDHKKLDPVIEHTIAEWERATPRVIHFANQVHRSLTPAQRKQLVALWDQKDEDLSDEERRAKEEEEITRVLDLTGSQKTRLVTPLLGVYLQYYGPIGDVRKSWKDAKAAFALDTFDANSLMFFTGLPLRTLARAIFEASESVLAVLSPEQRETLAVTIEADWRK